MHYFAAKDAPTQLLLERLSLTRGKSAWSQILRRGTFEIDGHDYHVIAEAMASLASKGRSDPTSGLLPAPATRIVALC